MEVKHKHKDVVVKRIDGELVVTSRHVAVDFEKRHDHILRNIEILMENDTTQNWGQYFIKDSYKDNSGKSSLLEKDDIDIINSYSYSYSYSRALYCVTCNVRLVIIIFEGSWNATPFIENGTISI